MKTKTKSLSLAPDLQELADDVASLIADYGHDDAERRELLKLGGGEAGR